MKMSNKAYDFWKYVAQIALPALGTLYYTVGKIWGLPFIEEITATILAADAFLGALLKLSTNIYNKNLNK